MLPWAWLKNARWRGEGATYVRLECLPMPMDLLNVDAALGMVEECPLERRGEARPVSIVLLLANRPLLFPVFTDRSKMKYVGT